MGEFPPPLALASLLSLYSRANSNFKRLLYYKGLQDTRAGLMFFLYWP